MDTTRALYADKGAVPVPRSKIESHRPEGTLSIVVLLFIHRFNPYC